MRVLLLFLITGCAALTPDEAHLEYTDGGALGSLNRLESEQDFWAVSYGLTWYLPQPEREYALRAPWKELPPADSGDSVPDVGSVEREPWYAGRLDQLLAFLLGSGALAGGLYGRKRMKGDG